MRMECKMAEDSLQHVIGFSKYHASDVDRQHTDSRTDI